MMNQDFSIKNDIKRQKKQSVFLLKNLGLSAKKGLGMNEEFKKYRLMRKMDFARI